ncbi:MAG TPA: RluA family pseudouridine synthase [Pirellulaceae bacterium]|nr:RluA family pseudouridine synthase [Pirellulaceae bacterium]HMO90967.1 RluA family pseudouridine synthase [Pirellulaceae bacterium]HMP69865.1 RluA family pseudouridine synthase [Pirellulaceae bacterium]
MPKSAFEFIVDQAGLGFRVDVFIAQKIDGLSRSRAGELVRSGLVLINGQHPKASVRLKTGDLVTVSEIDLSPELPTAENIQLDVLFEDDALIAINKPAGMVVHPAKGHWQGTLTAGLMHHFSTLSQLGGPQRPGIVHRLDRDTSGVILIAKTDKSHSELTLQFQQRSIEKQYLAIVSPPPNHDRGHIEQPIGPHPYQREKMAVRDRHPSSREAITYFEVKKRVGRIALVNAFPKTGRTHQIRVHLAHVGSPVLCDKLYSGRSCISRAEFQGQLGTGSMSAPEDMTEIILARQALHAESISFYHPLSKRPLHIKAPHHDDLTHVLGLMDLLK